MDISIPKKEYQAILDQIKSTDSPVGIDAGKTHVLILYKLIKLEERLDQLEQQLQKEK